MTLLVVETKAHCVCGWSWIPGCKAKEAGPSSTAHNHMRKRRLSLALSPMFLGVWGDYGSPKQNVSEEHLPPQSYSRALGQSLSSQTRAMPLLWVGHTAAGERHGAAARWRRECRPCAKGPSALFSWLWPWRSDGLKLYVTPSQF